MSKEAVRNIDPAAYAMPTRVLESFPVRVAIWAIVGYKGEAIGQGNTEDAAWQNAAIRMDAPVVQEATPAKQTTTEVMVNAILAGCASGELDPGDNYPGARANRPGALREHVEGEVSFLLSKQFKPAPTRK